MIRPFAVGSAIVSIATVALLGQTPPDAQPIARMHHALGYDARAKHVVLFGGATNDGQLLSDFWRWDGARWTLVARTTMQSAGHVLFSDKSGALFMAGGTVGISAKWNGTQWTSVVADRFAARVGVAGAYDDVRGRLVIHGGSARPREELADTVEFDGAAWKQIATTGPSARMTASMAFDSARGLGVLFGGLNTRDSKRFGDTWEWNGTTWTQVAIAPATSPSVRNGAGIVYDPVRRNVVLFGGMDATGTVLADTWVWNGRAWRRIVTAGPSARTETYMAFDAARGVAVLFGGDDGARLLADTWEWNGATWVRRAP